MVVNELRGEKVDIVSFTEDPAEFVMKALAPARVREVRIHPETGTAEVIVPDFQLSLAIGKEGQNARLAARLTGWRVDIKSESQLAEEESGGGVEYAEGEWVENASGELVWQPAEGGETISAAEAGYAGIEAPSGSPAPAPETSEAPADSAAEPSAEAPVPPDGESAEGDGSEPGEAEPDDSSAATPVAAGAPNAAATETNSSEEGTADSGD
jgi:N utilization substance protein A